MQNRAARMLLFCLFIAAIGVASFLFWRGQAHITSETEQLNAADASARTAARSLLEARAAQQAYVAAGQGLDYWAGRTAQYFEAARVEIATLHASASSPQVLASLDATGSTIDDLGRVDKRATEHVKAGQRLLASDLVFTDGPELTVAALASLEQARNAEVEARQNLIATLRERQAFALIAAAAASMLTVLLLLPTGRREYSTASHVERAAAAARPAQPLRVEPPLVLESDGWDRAAPLEPDAGPVTATADTTESIPPPAVQQQQETIVATREEIVVEPVLTVAPVVAMTDFPELASLCVDLARVSDTRALPSLLDRAATVLDASGIILWIADPDGRELNPIFAQGYPAQLINRLGTIPRDAENATAAAFRTSLLQTVNADQISPGAIAAPLVTSGGCVGVMAAEVRHKSERQEMTLAAATIVAAQLATLVGPPSARQTAKTG